ncbi:DUF2333 family protein [Halieaceae bacterium IMCC14734]|uniref:DUF2333 family protein n=1 Tax=Candidatus Litorirhabdus singularis TaxID=2518993 RepID=A0ABT3TLX3_9GAMM|nr:DUF2333 family protein [Candidatus Litorirhabdus singularis]MCX2983336.1 DUF2333 family protein [Candidatus Litorirhabdus singularis]
MSQLTIKERLASIGDRVSESRGITRWLAIGLGVYLLLATVVGMYWSITPSRFDVVARSEVYVAASGGRVVTGSVTTAALMGVMETLLDKPGGFLRNDMFPPGLWLDNMPNWEYGVLIQVRDLARAMREVHSRSQSQSKEDQDLSAAEPMFNFSADSWALPQSEGEYRRGLKHVHSYYDRLSDASDRDAQFYARADNLRYWLSTVESRLGSLSQRLSTSVGQRRLNTDLAGDVSSNQSTYAPSEEDLKTPWLEIDDVFYEARGASWALIHFLKAAEVDFADVLEGKNARVSLQQIVRELEATQELVFSPMILNGSGFGLVANHSLVMASYISRANAAIIDLRRLLEDG